MALTDEQLIILKNELDTDPIPLGYATKSDEECAAVLNEPGASGETLPNTTASSKDVLDAIDMSEIGSIPVNKMQFFHARMQPGEVHDISNGSIIRTQVINIFAGCTNTLIALGALQTRDASRAEILFGAGVSVTYLDVGRARNL